MSTTCPAPADAPLVRGLVDSVDCAADGLLAHGYAALAAPTGPVAMALTGALTLFVGFYAYRLLFGRTAMDAGAATLAVVKIGVVLVLASNWAIYQQVVAQTLFEAPQAIAGLIMDGLDHSGSVLAADPIDALQEVFDEMTRDVRSLAGHAGDRSPLLGGAPFAVMVLNGANYALVLSSAGVLAATRIGLALLLAIGPVVAGFLLFSGTRGLVTGWLRAMIALAVASLGASVLLSIELLVLEPTLILLAQQRATDAILAETGMRAGLVIGVFLIAKIGALAASAMVAHGLRFPDFPPAAGRVDVPAAPPVTSRAENGAAGRAGEIARSVASVTNRTAAPARAHAAAMKDAFTTGERWRTATASSSKPASISDAGDNRSTQRPVRPRRELLVARRKR